MKYLWSCNKYKRVFAVAAMVARDNMALQKWILVFSVMLVGDIVTSQPCQRLFMQGLDNTQILPYAELSGLYRLTNITSDGFPAYRHETHSEEFSYNSTRRNLVLGRGLLLAQTSGRLPRNNVQYPYDDVITAWRVYQPATKRFSLQIFFVFFCLPHRISADALCFRVVRPCVRSSGHTSC